MKLRFLVLLLLAGLCALLSSCTTRGISFGASYITPEQHEFRFRVSSFEGKNPR
jgi:hypothetical protein